MNISELIDRLEEIKEEEGDLEVTLDQVGDEEDGEDNSWDAEISEVETKDSEEGDRVVSIW